MDNKLNNLFNIELHGFSLERSTEVAEEIRNLLKEKKYVPRCAIFFMNDTVLDLSLRPCQFIRLVVITKNEHTDDLVALLNKLEYDIELTKRLGSSQSN